MTTEQIDERTTKLTEADAYNGWPSWETADVVIELDNIEAFYRAKVRIANLGQGWNALRVLLRETYGVTQTMEGTSLRNRRLDLEVLDHWVRDEREEPPTID